jgi:hypothetical protein
MAIGPSKSQRRAGSVVRVSELINIGRQPMLLLPVAATCPDATIGIDLRKRLFLLVPDEENSPRVFLTMDALYRLS